MVAGGAGLMDHYGATRYHHRAAGASRTVPARVVVRRALCRTPAAGRRGPARPPSHRDGGAARGSQRGAAAVAHPIAVVQQHVAATQWMHAQGITSRKMVQKVDLPGLAQEPYQYDRASGQLTAVFHQDEGWLLPPIALAAETVTPGDQPCAPVLVAAGDAQDQQTPQGCEPSADGVWQLDLGNSTAGLVRETDGMTLAVTGPQQMAPVLRRALLAARPADDAQLFTRIEPDPFTVTDWLLL